MTDALPAQPAPPDTPPNRSTADASPVELSEPLRDTARFLPGLLVAVLFVTFLVARSETVTAREYDLLRSLREPGDPTRLVFNDDLFPFVRDLTAAGGYVLQIALFVVLSVYLLLAGRKREGIFFLTTMAVGYATGSIVKLVIARPRPDPLLVPQLSNAFRDTYSFPSLHATMSVICFVGVAAFLPGPDTPPAARRFLLGSAAVLAIAVGVTRVFLGVHFPTDVVAGWTLGVLALLIGQRLLWPRLSAPKGAGIS